MDGDIFLSSILSLINELPEELDPEMDSPFNNDTWGVLGTVLEFVEAVEFQHMLLSLHRAKQEVTGELCGAVEGYAHAVPILVNSTQRAMDRIAEFTANELSRLDTMFSSFTDLKLRAMANCETPGCTDRDEAREELGWEKQPLR